MARDGSKGRESVRRIALALLVFLIVPLGVYGLLYIWIWQVMDKIDLRGMFPDGGLRTVFLPITKYVFEGGPMPQDPDGGLFPDAPTGDDFSEATWETRAIALEARAVLQSGPTCWLAKGMLEKPGWPIVDLLTQCGDANALISDPANARQALLTGEVTLNHENIVDPAFRVTLKNLLPRAAQDRQGPRGFLVLRYRSATRVCVVATHVDDLP